MSEKTYEVSRRCIKILAFIEASFLLAALTVVLCLVTGGVAAAPVLTGLILGVAALFAVQSTFGLVQALRLLR